MSVSTTATAAAAAAPAAVSSETISEVLSSHPSERTDSSRLTPAAVTEVQENSPPTNDSTRKSDDDDAEPWPPKDWKDTFVRSQNASLVITNHPNVRTVVTRINTAPTLAQADDPKYKFNQPIAILFSALRNVDPEPTSDAPTPAASADATTTAPPPQTKKEFREWIQKNFVPYDVPDLRGVAKHMLIDRATFDAITLAKDHYGSIGLEFHFSPNPKVAGVFMIEEIYIFKGVGINAEIEYKTRCNNCDGPAPIECLCGAVHFCSRHCYEAAVVNGTHTFLDCDALRRKAVIADSVAARQRIIRVKDALDKDEKAQQQLIVRKAIEEADAKKSIEQKRKEQEDYQKIKKARLMESSRQALADLGMAPDPNIPEKIEVPESTDVQVKHGQPVVVPTTPLLTAATNSGQQLSIELVDATANTTTSTNSTTSNSATESNEMTL